MRQRWPSSRVGALLDIICGVQYLISSEMLASMVLLGGIASALFLLANRRDLAPMCGYAVHAGIVALGVGGVLLAGPVMYTLFGTGHCTEYRFLERSGTLRRPARDIRSRVLPVQGSRAARFVSAQLGRDVT